MTLGILWPVVRRLGALSLFIVGAVHLREYSDAYSAIPTIGPLFMLNFVAATVLGVGLLLPVELLLPRWRTAFVALLALGGVGLSATSLIMLWIAERRPLFGFMEPGYDPQMIQLARISEVVTVVLLGAYLLALLVGSSRDRGPDSGKQPTDETPQTTTLGAG
jgi:hypothetical protein